MGMQLVDETKDLNVFYFTHNRSDCGTTFVVPAGAFLPFITEPVPDEVTIGTDECNKHCLAIDDLAVCYAHCRYAPFRRLLLAMRDQVRTDATAPVPTVEQDPHGR